MIWREKRILLAILGALLIANAIFFFTYRVQYQSRLKALDDRRQKSEARLTQARSHRLTAERRVTVYRRVQSDVKDIYDKQWGTERQRLTQLISEVKRLAVASNMIPTTTSYSRAAVARPRKGSTPAEEMGITFTVRGDYQQVRRLINLLELSRQFVIIDQIGLSSPDTQNLTLNLHLKTLFRDTTSAARQL
jgi:Type II secretion system (T2SS), protein M subtype b